MKGDGELFIIYYWIIENHTFLVLILYSGGQTHSGPEGVGEACHVSHRGLTWQVNSWQYIIFNDHHRRWLLRVRCIMIRLFVTYCVVCEVLSDWRWRWKGRREGPYYSNRDQHSLVLLHFFYPILLSLCLSLHYLSITDLSDNYWQKTIILSENLKSVGMKGWDRDRHKRISRCKHWYETFILIRRQTEKEF